MTHKNDISNKDIKLFREKIKHTKSKKQKARIIIELQRRLGDKQ